MEGSVEFKQLTEQEVWQHLKKGRIDALSYFYQKYYADLFFYGKKLSSSEEMAQDCIQDLFLRIWRKQHTLGNVTACRAYLLKSYRRLLIDRLKSNRKSILMDAMEVPFQSDVSIEELTIDEEREQEQHHLLQRGLDALPRKQREIIYLRFYRDLSYQEIAEVLGINNQSVRNAVHTSLKILKKSFLLLISCFGSMIR